MRVGGAGIAGGHDRWFCQGLVPGVVLQPQQHRKTPPAIKPVQDAHEVDALPAVVAVHVVQVLFTARSKKGTLANVVRKCKKHSAAPEFFVDVPVSGDAEGTRDHACDGSSACCAGAGAGR